MKIGQPVSDIPGGGKAHSKYSEAYSAAIAAAPSWIPIECESRAAARYLVNAARASVKPKLDAAQRGASVFLRVHSPALKAVS